jgi:hypothetical protein
LWRFHVDWGTPASSTLTDVGAVPVTPVTLAFCNLGAGPTTDCVQQPGTGVLLDTLGDRLMNHLDYRRFPDTVSAGGTTVPGHESLVVNHAQLLSPFGTFPTRVGIRWYELQDPNGTPTVAQQGTYAPATDANSRWMASVAINGMGEIGLGFSDSSTTLQPSVHFTGHSPEAGDAAGVMGQGEGTMINGSGVQTLSNRWGDYTNITVDPSDDCTFWYTNQYQLTNDTTFGNWHTRFGSFQVTSCSSISCTARAAAIIANTGQIFDNGGTLVDSYQSSRGPYGGANVGSQGNVRAGTTVVHNGGVIHGGQLQHSPAGLKPIPPPPGATNLGNFNVNSGQTATLTRGDYVATNLNLNGTLVITGGAVRIWVTGFMNLGGTANLNGIPQNLQFLYTGTNTVSVNSGGRGIFGFIYAPDAPVILNEAIFGAVVGSTVTLNGGSAVHFDVDSSGTTSSTTVPAPCPTLPAGSCTPTGSQTVFIDPNTNNVDAYLPLGSWSETTTGVRHVRIEGPSLAPATIATPNAVNSCASDNVRGNVVCTDNVGGAYIINGVAGTLTTTLAVPVAGGLEEFSGGTCQTCGVALDPVNDRAAIMVGLASTPSGGFQFLNLATNMFSPAIPAGPAPSFTSEDILVDPLRGLLLSPTEGNDYQLVNSTPTPSNSFEAGTFHFNTNVPSGQFDSAALDCSTGIALAPSEFSSQIYLVDLSRKTTGVGSNWAAGPIPPAPATAATLQNVPEFASFTIGGTSGIAVAPGSALVPAPHLGIVADEFDGSTAFGAFRLPASGGVGTSPVVAPALQDWVATAITVDPDGAPWSMGRDPHTTTAFTSPNTGDVFGVLMNLKRTFLAVIDLNALLAAPRTANAHGPNNVAPANLTRTVKTTAGNVTGGASSIVTFIRM